MPRPRTGTGDEAGGLTVAGAVAVDATGVADETGEGVSDVATVEDRPDVGAAAPETLP